MATRKKTVVDDSAVRLAAFEAIAKKYLDLADPNDLCDDGKEVLRELQKLMNIRNKVTKTVSLIVKITDYELPPCDDWDDYLAYRITVKDSEGKVIVENAEPDDIDDATNW